MLTTLLALCFAVALAIGYAVVSSRFDDDGSVVRRQVDTWAIVAAFACLLFMGTGAADAAREASVRRLQVSAVRAHRSELPAVAVRHRRPTLRTTDGPVALGPVDVSVAAGPRADRLPGPDSESAESPGPIPVPEGGGERGYYADAPEGQREQPYLGIVSDDVAIAGADDPPTVALPWQPSLRGPWPAPTPRLVVYASPTPTRLPIEPLPPTPPPPTPPMQALPTATPHCGSPDRIEVALEIQRAEVERRDDELIVRYTAAFTNRASFPVTVADLSVTALSGSSGSELYGHDAKPDMLLPPSDRVVFEGAVTLDKAPSPFGTTELCIAFVGETCGLRRPYEVQRRCITVRGF